jgi:hypothetical protein
VTLPEKRIIGLFWFWLCGTRLLLRLHIGVGRGRGILNDDQKRKILLAAAELKLAKRPAILTRLNWLLKKVGQLSGYRNIAAHLPLGLERNAAGEYVVAPGEQGISSPTSSQKFIFVQLERERFWETLAEDYYLLGQYAVWLTWHVSGKLSPSRPLPYRPRLPSLAAIQRVDQIIEAANRALAKPPRRRRPSRTKLAQKLPSEAP